MERDEKYEEETGHDVDQFAVGERTAAAWTGEVRGK